MSKGIGFQHITETVKKALIVSGLFLLLMTVFRAVFFAYFSDFAAYKGMWGYVLRAFVLGVRYDLVIVAYINVPVTLSLLAVWALKSRRTFAGWLLGLKIYYIAMFSFVLLLLFVDFGFYSYFKDHINIVIFGVIEDDTAALAKTIAQNRFFPVAAVILGLLEYGLVRIIAHNTVYHGSMPPRTKHPVWLKTVFVAALVLGNGLAARGSLKMFPLGTIDAAISPNNFINKLSLNGMFTFAEAVEARWNEGKGSFDIAAMTGYEGKPEQAFSDFLGKHPSALKKGLVSNIVRRTRASEAVSEVRPNVILIVLEGFGTDLLSYDSPEFDVLGSLRKHFASDYVFYNFLPSDIGTIGSLESILVNMPKRPNSRAITQSKYAFFRFPSAAAEPYRKAGYNTVFIYGGNLGWRNLISFVPLQGFETADGEGAMHPDALKNEWGVYDEYLYAHIYKKLSENTGRPKFIMAMSTGNHPPYSVPKDYKMLPLNISPELERRITGDRKLAAKRFGTYQYANQKLGELITRIKRSEFGRNTVIAVTGDHNFWDVFDYGSDRALDRFSVPLYIYVPDRLKPSRADTEVFGSHIDIMPTLYNLTLSKTEYTAIGRDLFDPGEFHSGYISEGFIFSQKGAVYCNLAKGAVSYFTWDKASKRKITPAVKAAGLDRQLVYYRSSLAVSEYLIRSIK